MSKKIILIVLGIFALILSIYWGLSQNSKVEPWTASISALLFLIGILLPNDKANSKEITQRNIFSFFNTSKIKKNKGKVKQSNFFGLGNTQEVDNE